MKLKLLHVLLNLFIQTRKSKLSQHKHYCTRKYYKCMRKIKLLHILVNTVIQRLVILSQHKHSHLSDKTRKGNRLGDLMTFGINVE